MKKHWVKTALREREAIQVPESIADLAGHALIAYPVTTAASVEATAWPAIPYPPSVSRSSGHLGVSVIAATKTNDPTSFTHEAHQVKFRRLPGHIQVLYITGLDASTGYSLTLQVLNA